MRVDERGRGRALHRGVHDDHVLAARDGGRIFGHLGGFRGVCSRCGVGKVLGVEDVDVRVPCTFWYEVGHF